MSIFVNRITKITQQLPKIPSKNLPYAVNLNCLNFFPNNIEHGIPLYQLTPYYLRDEEDHIFENVWQGSKIYESFIEFSKEIHLTSVDGNIVDKFDLTKLTLFNKNLILKVLSSYKIKNTQMFIKSDDNEYDATYHHLIQ